MIELNKIYNEECLEGMKRIPDKSVDMILCDLPYGTTKIDWDVIIPFDKLWEQYYRIIKDKGIICLTGSEPFTSQLIMSNPKQVLFKEKLTWIKHRPSNFANAKYRHLKYTEDIIDEFSRVHDALVDALELDEQISDTKLEQIVRLLPDYIFSMGIAHSFHDTVVGDMVFECGEDNAEMLRKLINA